MAKRRVVPRNAGGGVAAAPNVPPAVDRRGFTPASLLAMATAMVAAAIVVAGYWPSDSIAVQSGSARYLVGWLLVSAGVAMLAAGRLPPEQWLIDALAWALAGWMAVATWANAPEVNLRLAVNEGWWWVAAAALLTAARRCAGQPHVAWALLHIILAVTLGVAVFGWHQLLVGFPAMIAEYEADPDAVLREAGIFAQPGSAQRIIFENRLYDGGPTGTFALANSMAALLVGGVLAMVAMLALQWRHLGVLQRLAWLAAIVVSSGMLLASRSRSAVVSVLVVAVAYVCLRWLGRHRKWPWGRRLRGRGAVAALVVTLAAVGIGLVASWRTWHQSEWVAQAPASLAIRLNYWRASVQMLAQSPLVGVGPGQFKARYEAYRAAASTEQIADPHNWVWQALTTGGLPAGLLLVGLIAGALVRSRGRGPERTAEQSASSPRPVIAGAGAAAVAVWVLGAAIGYVPALEPALIASVVGIAWLAVAVSGDRGVAATDPLDLVRLARWALVAMLINLLAAGGIIVPGVAVTLWVLVAIAAPCRFESVDRPGDAGRWLLGGTAGALLVTWYITAVLPVDRAAALMGRFEAAWSQGRYGEAEAALQQATIADLWDPEPPLQLSQVRLQQALFDPQQRQRWEAAWQRSEAECLRRAGKDPAIIRMLADGRLWHYQRYGDPTVLRAAADLYRQAVKLSPSHQTYAAQLAEVYRELGDPRAEELAQTAQRLSLAGGYYERSLPLVIIQVAQEGGEAALEGPVRAPAAEVLAPLLEPSN